MITAKCWSWRTGRRGGVLRGGPGGRRGTGQPLQVALALSVVVLAACSSRGTRSADLSAAAAETLPQARPPLAAEPRREKATPLADHHTHLFQRSIEQVYRPPAIPRIQLPEALARLVQEREAGWNDTSRLAGLYTAESVVFNFRTHHWIRGRKAVAEFMGSLYTRPYRLRPVNYQTHGSSGHVAGYYTRGDGPEEKIFGNFLLALERGQDAEWRISAETPAFAAPNYPDPFTADRLIALLDVAGIRRATVLSTAYWFGSGSGPAEAGEYEKVRAETDWVAQQVSRFPDRLVGFCSFNPLKDYALQALEYCASKPNIKGLKQHFGDSRVDLKNPEHVARVRRVWRAANELGIAIVVDLMTPDPTYGREHSEIFLQEIVSSAPDIPIQIAHLAGSGPGYNKDEAFAVFAEAASAGDPRMKNVYADVATVITTWQPPEELALIARRLRQFGIERVLYGSDHPASSIFTPDAGWLFFRRLPLSEDEFSVIANNLAPYMR